MARTTPRALPDRDHDEADAPDERPAGATTAPDWAAHVRDLQSGERIYVYRTAPIVAKGYLGILTLPSERFEDLLELLKQTWGGGTFRIQRYTPAGDFARGGATVDISGPPLVDGEPIYPGGSRRPNPAPTPSPTPMVIHQPAPPSGDTTGVVQALAGLVTSLSSQAGQHSTDPSAGIGGLVQLAQQLTGVRPADPFEQFERFARLFKMMQGSSRRDDGDDDDGDEPSGMMGALGPIMQMMQRGMSDAQPQRPTAAPQCVWNGTSWIYTGPTPPPGVPPPGPPPGPPPQAVAQTPASAPTPNPAPTPIETASEEEEEWEEVPITAADVAEHVQGLTDAEAQAFLADVMRRLGVEMPT
jgi:hypothetical protein